MAGPRPNLPASELLIRRFAGITSFRGRWTDDVFLVKGAELSRALLRVARTVRAERAARLARQTRQWFNSISRNLDERLRGRVGYTLSVVGVVDDVLEEAAITGVLSLSPTITEGISTAYDTTGRLMGVALPDPDRTRLARAGGEIADRIVNINETTRSQIRGVITTAVNDGRTPQEVAQLVRDQISGSSASRSMTIARTEMGRAFDTGTLEALTQSGLVSHISVIGCQKREPSSPTYRGESTCNIQDVPIEDAPLLEFHPNHTGVIVASRFYGD